LKAGLSGPVLVIVGAAPSLLVRDARAIADHHYRRLHERHWAPDVSAAKVREFGRFVKNQRLPYLADVMRRAPVEIGVAAHRLLVGSLRMEIDAIVGDIEEGGAKRNMDFLHWPTVVISCTLCSSRLTTA
jgi:hypothetical protein